MGGHHFVQPYTLSALLVYQTVASPLSLMWYAMTFSFLQPCLSFLHPGWGPLMYSYALLGESHELWTCRLIFLIFSIITSPPCLLHSTIFTFSSVSQLSLRVVTLHIFFTWNVDSSHINVQKVVVSPFSFHHLTLTRRFQLEGLSHGMQFHVFISNLGEFIHSFQFLIEVRFIDDQGMHTQKKKKNRNDMFVLSILLH